MYDFEKIARFLPFLREAIGQDAEILLCDTERILYAENPITDRVKPGNKLGDMERSFLEEGTYKTRDSVVSYRALLPSRERLRASTMFLKNDDGSLAGFLTINIRVEALLKVRDMVDAMINGTNQSGSGNPYTPDPQPELLNRYEGVNVMVEDIIDEGGVLKIAAPPVPWQNVRWSPSFPLWKNSPTPFAWFPKCCPPTALPLRAASAAPLWR